MVREVTGCMRARPSTLEMGFEQQILQDLRHPKVHRESLEASAGHHVVPYSLAMQQTAA